MAVPENMGIKNDLNKDALDTEKVYPLRPHHGMCLAFFIGKGYSDAFTVNMRNMLDKFMEGATVKIIAAPDEICWKCPNRQGNACVSEEKVAGYDKAVLDACGLKEGKVLEFDEFTQAVQKCIIDSGIRETICGDCGWNGICSNAKSRWKICPDDGKTG